MNDKLIKKWIKTVVIIQILAIVGLFVYPCRGVSGFMPCDYIYKVVAVFYGIPISLIFDLCLWRLGLKGMTEKWSVGRWIGSSLVVTILVVVGICVVLRNLLRVVGLGLW